MKTLLAIGDKKDFDTYLKFYRNHKYFKEYGYQFETVDYSSALKGDLPQINTDKIVVFLFFPFLYWDEHIEKKKDRSVYGNRTYYEKFIKFWNMMRKTIEGFYKEREIHYINRPEYLATDRDKESTKNILAKAGVSVSCAYGTRDHKKISAMLDKGKKLYIKVRFGSMGKGITYLEKDKWMTNFTFRNKRIKSRKSDYGWKFHDITGNTAFLKTILKEDVIIEDAIEPLVLRRKKYDLRIYVCFGRVIYIYPRSTGFNNVTTNISQGAKGEPQSFLKEIPPEVLSLVRRDAIKALKAMNLNFGGVDIMPEANGKNVTVIEINAFPGFPKSKSYNLSKDIIKIIARQKWR